MNIECFLRKITLFSCLAMSLSAMSCQYHEGTTVANLYGPEEIEKTDEEVENELENEKVKSLTNDSSFFGVHVSDAVDSVMSEKIKDSVLKDREGDFTVLDIL